MSRKIFYLCSIILLVFLNACGSKKTISTPTNFVDESVKDFYSDIVINYKLDKSGIKDTFNTTISEAFKGNFDIPEYDVKMTLSKPKEASVEIEGKNLLVVVPVGIFVEKKTFLTDLTARGTLEMSFITEMDIDSIWNFKTKTSLSNYRWVEKPKLNLAGLSLPIETIANTVLTKSKAIIEQNIDDSVRANFTLKEKMRETMSMFDQPIQMDPNLNAWLNVKPELISLGKIKNSKLSSQGKIGIHALSSFSTYRPNPNVVSKNLPKAQWSESIPDSSLFRVVADIKMIDINQMIKANLDGQSFSAGDKSITLSNSITNCDYEYLRVVTDVNGTVNGTLIIKGKPKYDPIANGFYMENIDIQLKTKNVLHKAAAWIAEGKVRSEMEAQLKFSLEEYIQEIQNNINTSVSDYNKKMDMEMKVGVGSVRVESFKLFPGQIQAIMKSKFYLEVRLKDFRTFGKM